MRPSLFLIPLLVSSAACSQQAEAVRAPATDDPAGATATASASSSSTSSGGSARAVAESTDAYEFKYSYPAQAGAYPELRGYLDSNLSETRAQLVKDAEAWKVEAAKGAIPFHPYSSGTEWKVVANLPGWLSLSNDFNSFSGGAHGMYGRTGLLFDKQAKAIRQPMDLFTSPAVLWSAVEKRFCAALKAEREKRIGMPSDTHDQIFGACPEVSELTLFLGSANGKTFDRMSLYAGPYVAGAYAEGAYEIDVDVDDAVLNAVKPEFAAAFTRRQR